VAAVKGALDVHRALLAAGVAHEVVQLDSRIATADELPRALGLASGCLVVRCYQVSRGTGEQTDPDTFAAVLVPAGRVPRTVPLLAALSARAVRPARPAEVNAVTEFAAELVSPVDLPPVVELVADAALQATDVVYTAVGEGGLALGIRTRDLLAVTRPQLAALTAPAPPAAMPGSQEPSGEREVVLDLDSPPPGGARQAADDPPRVLRTTRSVPPAT
jgi:prolyl-tRNA editing enzyme YbaK/EbsC (Cys-tRNA(Pro) deacylase)